jgi:DNA-dependent RNA polymerase auxiliary subunit epsilon
MIYLEQKSSSQSRRIIDKNQYFFSFFDGKSVDAVHSEKILIERKFSLLKF